MDAMKGIARFGGYAVHIPAGNIDNTLLFDPKTPIRFIATDTCIPPTGTAQFPCVYPKYAKAVYYVDEANIYLPIQPYMRSLKFKVDIETILHDFTHTHFVCPRNLIRWTRNALQLPVLYRKATATPEEMLYALDKILKHPIYDRSLLMPSERFSGDFSRFLVSCEQYIPQKGQSGRTGFKQSNIIKIAKKLPQSKYFRYFPFCTLQVWYQAGLECRHDFFQPIK